MVTQKDSKVSTPCWDWNRIKNKTCDPSRMSSEPRLPLKIRGNKSQKRYLFSQERKPHPFKIQVIRLTSKLQAVGSNPSEFANDVPAFRNETALFDVNLNVLLHI